MKEVLDNLVLDVYSNSIFLSKIVRNGEVIKEGNGRYVLEINGSGSRVIDVKGENDTLSYSVNGWGWISAPCKSNYDSHPFMREIYTLDEKLTKICDRKGKWNKNQMYCKKE